MTWLKIGIASALFIGTAAAAIAQSQPTVTLKVDHADLALIGKGLGMLPYNEVATLMGKLQAQVIEQQKSAEPKPAAKEPAKK